MTHQLMLSKQVNLKQVVIAAAKGRLEPKGPRESLGYREQMDCKAVLVPREIEAKASRETGGTV